ncbi:MAG TPA: ROK family protein [Patescibacteria group bacterium]|nr:ROK family protein [Patescibacteria group bacterium]
MYLAADVGGTKTLVAAFDEAGNIVNQVRFPTSPTYQAFTEELAVNVAKLSTTEFKAGAFGIPGNIDRQHGVGLVFGNLNWHNVPMDADAEKMLKCPVEIENDAKLGALSEAILVKDQYSKVLYITIGTGIGIGLVVNGQLDTAIGDAGGRTLLVEHDGQMQPWESFASGKAIVEKFGKPARDITDGAAWQEIASNIAVGLIDVVALAQPDAIIIGGGVGSHFAKFDKFLDQELRKYEKPMLNIPPLLPAKRAEEAVIYGCYELLRSKYGNTSS